MESEAMMAMAGDNRANRRRCGWLLAACALCFAIATPTLAQQPAATPAAPVVATYADLAELVGKSRVVAVVQVSDQAVVEAARAPGLAPGHARLYLTTQVQSVLFGTSALGANQAFLADVPLNAKGRVPKLKKARFLIFANAVSGRPGTLQLVEPDAMFNADPALQERVRRGVEQAAARDAPPVITGVREAFSIAGNLAGESETQVFLDTANGSPVSLSVVRRPGMDPHWGVSWTEIVDQSARAPGRETLAWYRLACSLPQQLPVDAVGNSDRVSRMQADADYRFILDQLGPCERVRHGGSGQP